MALVGLGTTSCADDEPSDATSAAGGAPVATTGAPAEQPHGPNALGCVTRTPGEPLDRDEAIVRFTAELVCPGYVTVAAGTPVTFVNEDETPHTLTVTVMAATGELGAVVLSEEIPPGDYIEQRFDDPGILAFTTDALPAFRGTVEVQEASAARP